MREEYLNAPQLWGCKTGEVPANQQAHLHAARHARYCSCRDFVRKQAGDRILTREAVGSASSTADPCRWKTHFVLNHCGSKHPSRLRRQ